MGRLTYIITMVLLLSMKFNIVQLVFLENFKTKKIKESDRDHYPSSKDPIVQYILE